MYKEQMVVSEKGEYSLKKGKILCVSVSVILLVLILFPYVESIYYTLPSADDFVCIRGKGAGTQDMLLSSAHIANSFWLTWQGQWPVIFLVFLTNPLNFDIGYNQQLLGSEMILSFLLLIVSLWAVVHSFLKYQAKLKNILLEIGLLNVIVFSFLNIMIYTETLYWFSGAIYIWGLTLHLWSLALVIKYMNINKTVGNTIGLSVVGFLACMSAYIGAVLQGMVMLLYLWERQENRIKRCVPLVFMILGGCLSALAPGNFKRAELVASERISFWELFHSTGYYYLKSIQMLITNPIFWISLFVMIIVGIRTGEKNKKVKGEIVKLLKYIILSSVSVFFVIFPVELGYNGARVPERVYSFINMYNLLTIFAGAYVFGGILAIICSKKRWMSGCNLTTVLGIISVIVISFASKSYYQMPYFIITTRMDSIKWINNAWADILLQIEESDEANVVVYSAAFDTYILKEPGITDNKDDWANMIVADFYGKESVQLIMK